MTGHIEARRASAGAPLPSTACPAALRPTPGARFVAAVLLGATLGLGGCASSGSGVPVEDRSGRAAPPPPPVSGTVSRAGTPAGTAHASEYPPETTAGYPPLSPAPEAPAPQFDPATLALLEQSDRAAASGSYPDAIAYVERALRIDGQNVELWLRLADLHLAASRPASAEQLAQRAIAMAGARLDWQRRGWLIVAAARDAQGDPAEAERIRLQWRTARG